jgi:hypothetical protein
MLTRSLKTTTNQEIIAVNVFVNLVRGSQDLVRNLAVQANLRTYMLFVLDQSDVPGNG